MTFVGGSLAEMHSVYSVAPGDWVIADKKNIYPTLLEVYA